MSKDITEKFLKDHYLPKPEALLSLTTPEEIENATNILILGNIGNLVCKEGGKAKSYVATNSDAYKTHLALIRRIIKSEKKTVFVISSTLRREMGKYLKSVAGIRDVDDLPNTIFYTADFTKKNFSDNFFIMEKDVKFDLILANPPFDGSLGGEITNAIINNIDFDNYINLMPVSKYKKGELYQHIIKGSLKPIEWEGDASTNPQICKLSKKRDNSITEEEFNVWCYDPRFEKFYRENQKRKATWVCDYKNNEVKKWDRKKVFMLTRRSPTDGVHKFPKNKDYLQKDYKKGSISFDVYYNTGYPFERLEWPTCGPEGECLASLFSTEVEKQNIQNWWYSGKEKGLSHRLVKGMNVQSETETFMFLPKVDWSRSWTDEEILRDYGYSDEEIKELLK